jgi:hypothetical protein
MLQGLIDTKKEYTCVIENLLTVPICEKIYSIYMNTYKKGLKHFQIELNKIQDWNNYLIKQESTYIIKQTKCDYLPKLLKLTILASIKIKLYEFKKTLKNVNYNIPVIEDFVHRCLINAALFSWKNSYLFVQNNLRAAEIQNNFNIIEHNVRKIIDSTLMDFVNTKELIDYIEKISKKNIEKVKKPKILKKMNKNESQEVFEKQEYVISENKNYTDDEECSSNVEDNNENQDDYRDVEEDNNQNQDDYVEEDNNEKNNEDKAKNEDKVQDKYKDEDENDEDDDEVDDYEEDNNENNNDSENSDEKQRKEYNNDHEDNSYEKHSEEVNNDFSNDYKKEDKENIFLNDSNTDNETSEDSLSISSTESYNSKQNVKIINIIQAEKSKVKAKKPSFF